MEDGDLETMVQPGETSGSADPDPDPRWPVECIIHRLESREEGAVGHVFVNEKSLVLDDTEAQERSQVGVAERSDPPHLRTELLLG